MAHIRAVDCLAQLRELSGLSRLDIPSLRRMSFTDLEKLGNTLNAIGLKLQEAYRRGYARGEEDDRSRTFASSHGHDMGQ